MFLGVGVSDWKHWEIHIPKNRVKAQGTKVIKTLADLMVIADIAILTGSPRSETAGTWLAPGNLVVTCPLPTQTQGPKVLLLSSLFTDFQDWENSVEHCQVWSLSFRLDLEDLHVYPLKG